MAAAAWLSGGLSGLMYTATIFSGPFCGSNTIRQFFCNVPQLLALFDPNVILRELAFSVFILSLCFFCSSSSRKVAERKGEEEICELEISGTDETALDNRTALAFLKAMLYDRYVAICLPLSHEVITSGGGLGKMAAASWLSGGLSGLMYTATIFSVPFCVSNVICQFFCDVLQLLALSDPSVIVLEVGVTISAVSLAFLFLASSIVSYMYIFRAVLSLPAAEVRAKAFPTCLLHLAIVTFFVSTGGFAYLNPKGSPVLDLLLSLFYAVMPPSMNPLIYSLRNKDMKSTLWKILGGKL
ncbi:putative olfactory receptor 14L1 [Tachyglossus aculeatus]|uniref:putative olfactory receptor 14L1 n=1 Tax=Tachyglossus aculeatus TaxID=9261 RepID=UPI0018F41532|nr:putative olfactory receptor 14L1 [Tachyglossus aculeatus]